MSHLLYGCDVSRSNQRSLGNAKPGDLALIWVPDTKSLYGVFEIRNRIFYDETDIGWDGDWPYRCNIRLWDGYLRTIKDENKAKLMSYVSRELVTVNDLTNLGGYIHTLLYDEGAKLLKFFLANSEMGVPSSVFPEFGTDATLPPQFLDFSSRISPEMSEYNLEMYLLQHFTKLEEIVGTGINELYNMLFAYQGRFLDIMTVHRDEKGDPFKITIVELKAARTRLTQNNMNKALDELSSYMFWVKDQTERGKIPGTPDCVFGILVAPHDTSNSREMFLREREACESQYGVQGSKIHFVSFDVVENNLRFKPEI